MIICSIYCRLNISLSALGVYRRSDYTFAVMSARSDESPDHAKDNRWAVIVGIDLYSKEYPGRNLRGCVRDSEKVIDHLQSLLKIPSSHITAFQGRLGSHIDYSSPSAPTRANLIKELETLEKKEPGALIHFHYSGHGARAPTKYKDLKGETAKDEVLCTWQEYTTDVELGRLLDRLAEKHTVGVVLDCCHSGGADRYGSLNSAKDHQGPKIRCLRAPELTEGRPQDDQDWQQELEQQRQEIKSSGDEKSRGWRNAVFTKNQLYRDRKYNLIAACQPDELAMEWSVDTPGGEEHYGAMTYFLLQSLLDFGPSLEPVTYRNLLSVLQAKMKSNGLSQQPAQLGDSNHIIFSPNSLDISTFPLMANVTKVFGSTITLSKGKTSSIAVGDRFCLCSPSEVHLGLRVAKSTTPIEIKIRVADDFDSSGAPCDGQSPSLKDVKPGWFAQLSGRSKPTIINLRLPDAILNHMSETIRHYLDSAPLLDVKFNSLIDYADFTVTVDKHGGFQFQDRKGNYLRNLPHVVSDNKENPDNAKQLIGLLKHLDIYQLVLDASSADDRQPPPHEFELVNAEPDPENPKSLGACRIKFKNLHANPLYITIVNIGPAYGVHEIFPGAYASTQEVDPGSEIPGDVIVDLVVPDLLQKASRQPNFEMRDIFKLFITTKQVDFSHYLLPDLDLDFAKLKDAVTRAVPRARKVQTWTVEEREVITRLNSVY